MCQGQLGTRFNASGFRADKLREHLLRRFVFLDRLGNRAQPGGDHRGLEVCECRFLP